MNIKLLIISSMALYTTATNASLQVTTSSTPGTQCYSESSSLTLVRCYFGTRDYSSMPTNQCGQTYSENRNGCFVGALSTIWRYYCATMAEACAFCKMTTMQWGDWKAISPSTRHIVYRDVYSYDSAASRYECSAKTSTEYGCEQGFYTTATTGSSTMTCNRCPSTGTSENGNLAITGCYIPADGYFTDTTGSGTVTDKCSYQN